MRDMITVARDIQQVIPRKYKGWMEGLITNLDFIAPELRAERIAERLFMFIPEKPTEQWQFEALAIWMDKGVAEIEAIAGTIDASNEKELDFHDPVLHAWEGDEVVCKGYDAKFENGELISCIDNVPISGTRYTVEKIEVNESSASVYLKEIPGIAFNSIFFIMA